MMNLNDISTAQFIGYGFSSIGILAGLMYRFIDKRRKKFYYIITNRIVIDKSKLLDELEIRYKNEKIEKLVQTDVLFFNLGRKTVKFDELGKKTGMRLDFSKGTKVIDQKIIDYNNSNVDFNYEVRDNFVSFKFDYFKKGNYVKMEIYTDGNNNKPPILNCEFINDDKILEFNMTRYKINEFIRFSPIAFFSCLISLPILKYYNADEFVKFLTYFFSGSLGTSIFMYFRNKGIDKRIKEMFN